MILDSFSIDEFCGATAEHLTSFAGILSLPIGRAGGWVFLFFQQVRAQLAGAA